jgi:hypothetical protein
VGTSARSDHARMARIDSMTRTVDFTIDTTPGEGTIDAK